MPISDPPRRCPECGARTLVPLLMGLPTEEAEAAAARGEIALGGCCVMPGFDPEAVCTSCGYEVAPSVSRGAPWADDGGARAVRTWSPDPDEPGIDADRHAPLCGAEVADELERVVGRAGVVRAGAAQVVGAELVVRSLLADLGEVARAAAHGRFVDGLRRRAEAGAQRAAEARGMAERTARRAAELTSLAWSAADDGLAEVVEQAAAVELHLPLAADLVDDATVELGEAAACLLRIALGAPLLEPLDDAVAERVARDALAADEVLGPLIGGADRLLDAAHPVLAADADELLLELAGIVAWCRRDPSRSWRLHRPGAPTGDVRIVGVADGVAARREGPGSWQDPEPDGVRWTSDGVVGLTPAVDAIMGWIDADGCWAAGALLASSSPAAPGDVATWIAG